MLHVPVDAFTSAVAGDVVLRTSIDRFLRSLMVEMSQSAVCNKVHSVEQRTSRWLLHASDRAGTADLRLTHEFLSHMLGVRRASITTMIGIFSRAGLIESKRGLITISDPAGLAALACECYGIVRAASPNYEPRVQPVVATS
jgi:CRP-like cAMP-binding protein